MIKSEGLHYPSVTSVQEGQVQIPDATLFKVMTTNGVEGFYIVERKFLLNTLYIFVLFIVGICTRLTLLEYWNQTKLWKYPLYLVTNIV